MAGVRFFELEGRLVGVSVDMEKAIGLNYNGWGPIVGRELSAKALFEGNELSPAQIKAEFPEADLEAMPALD